jgi:uncharacterized membrane protein
MRMLQATTVLLLLAHVAAGSTPLDPPVPKPEACPFPENETIRVIEGSITIDRAPRDVYAFWRDLNHIPEFMQHVQSVKILDPIQSHWTVTGPFGVRVQWDVEILSDAPPSEFAWCTRKQGLIRHYGVALFKPDASSGGTDATLRLRLRPPSTLSRMAMALTGWDPEDEVMGSLERLKQVLERDTKKAPAS